MDNKTLLFWNSFKKNIEEVPFNKVLNLNLLYGLNDQLNLIKENTKNFLEGYSYNHALLWGVRGSGKSSLIRGIVQKFADEYDNFVTLEVKSDDISDLANIFLNFDFKKNIILFIDDLSFEQNDRRYIQFKSFLEGSFSNSKYNFLVYVTSNRRHLMKRDMIDNERSSAISQDEGIEEKVSLSDRFGLWVSFHNLNKNDFIMIVKNYFDYYKIPFNTEIEDHAQKWIFARGNRTGRSAYQFFKDYCAKNKIKIS
ncbi:ATP-binding protein [Alphaproteobacteria bacterium]|nr:ATP-binding protein [Alphaproteobacteria bacterium]